MKKIVLLLSVWCFAAGIALAQRVITGKVTDEIGEPLIGATVVVKGASLGTTTNTNGIYSLTILEGNNVLVVSYTGFLPKEVEVDPVSNIVDVVMSENPASLQEVVVTALGIKRDKKALGYASTVVSSQDIAEKPETDVARALIGRAPGVNIINSSGLAGSGTKINIRGTNTITGNSQPLWVVDGVPINTSSNEVNRDFRDGQITPTRNLDLDPNNIQSISVLRGLSATTLYGSQGRNGVILVTTKTGAGARKRFTASVSQTYHLVEAFVPEYQNKWGNGFDGDYGEFFSNWGSLLDGNRPRNRPRHPYFEHNALFPDFPEFKQAAGAAGDANPYIPRAYPNNVRDFFQTGYTATTSFNAGVSGDVGSFNVSFGRTGEEGYIANNNLDRYNFSIGGIANLTKKVTITGNFSYIKTDFKSPTIGAGLGSNSNGGPSVFANLFYTPRNIDLMGWPYQNPLTGAPLYYRNTGDITNPRWLLENSRQGSYTDRFLSVVRVDYSLLSWLKLAYRLGLDNYNEDQEYYVNRGASGFPQAVQDFSKGYYRTSTGRNTIYDHSVILSGGRNITNDLDFTANIGLNGRQDDYKQTGIASIDQVVFGLLEHRNFIFNSSRDIRQNNLSFRQRQIILGAFGDATLGYRNFLYLNVQGRNDWASTHEKEYRSLFYPGASLSFIPTQAIPGLESRTLNFLKMRVGYGTSANFATPYRTRPFLTLNSAASVDALGNVITLSLPDLLANPDLRPELQQELEGGIDFNMFDNRFGVEFSLYSRTAKDQIVGRRLDPATGFDETTINAGTISTKGMEITAFVTPIRMRNLQWNLRANLTRYRSKVEKLPEGSKEILISGFSNLGNYAIEGQPYGVIQGTYAVRSGPDGRTGDYLITGNGDYKISSEIGIIGDPNPDYMLSGFTDITIFGSLTLGGQVDFVKGGQIFSYTAGTMVGRGVAKELENFNPELPVILPGISEETGQPNNIPMPASGVFFGNTIIGGGPDDRGIFDATRLRIREVYLTYNLPARWFQRSFISGISVTAIANNPWYRAFNTPKYSKVDPDRTAFGPNGNGFGFDFLGGPSARRYGLSAKVNF